MSAQNLVKLVEHLAKLLVVGLETPETPKIPVEARAVPGESSNITIELRVPEAERGKVIGRQGRTIEAIRVLLSTAALQQGKRATLQLVEE